MQNCGPSVWPLTILQRGDAMEREEIIERINEKLREVDDDTLDEIYWTLEIGL